MLEEAADENTFKTRGGEAAVFQVQPEVLHEQGVGTEDGKEVGIGEGRASRRAGSRLVLDGVLRAGVVGIGVGVGIRLVVGRRARGVYAGQERGVERSGRA